MAKRLSEPPFPPPGERIAVIGTTGSGKTTIANWLARLIGAEHVELDALYWGPQWSKPSIEVFRQRVEQALAAPGWVVDGNYSMVRDLTWGKADTLVWLDYSLPIILWRLTWRTLGRIFRHEVLWNSNKESFRGTFFDKESLFLYAISSQRKQRMSYPQVLCCGEFTHLQIVHLRTPRETNEWLKRLVKEYN
jgi:adenylate kinase family enzyme